MMTVMMMRGGVGAPVEAEVVMLVDGGVMMLGLLLMVAVLLVVETLARLPERQLSVGKYLV